VGRYALYGEIASGGMATVHYGRLLGPVGFSRTVAIKRLHAQYAKDPEFAAMFLDEARLAARIRHPNVVQTLDVVALDGELFLVMDYIQGESLGRLIRASSAKKQPLPLEIVSSIICGVLHGLHAAHEATNEHGEPLTIVHRDVSPQNVLVGADGVPRVLDFGVAKAAGRMQTTREGQLKGKIAYMSPEQLRAGTVDRRTDVYAAGVVLWETLVRKHLFSGDSEGAVVTKVLEHVVPAPSTLNPDVPSSIDAIVLRAIERDPEKRFATTRQMALALEAAIPIASPTRVTEWLEGLVGELLAERAKSVALVEKDSGISAIPMAIGSAPSLVQGGSDPGSQATRITGSDVRAAPMPRSSSSQPGAASQVSSISVSTSALQAQLAPKPRGRRGLLVAGGIAVVALASAGLVWRTRVAQPQASPGASSTAIATSSMAGSTSSVPVPPAPPPSVTPPAVTASATIAPPAATTSATAAAPVRHPLHPPGGRISVAAPPTETARVPTPPAPPPSSAGPSCTYRPYVDDNGLTNFIKECK